MSSVQVIRGGEGREEGKKGRGRHEQEDEADPLKVTSHARGNEAKTDETNIRERPLVTERIAVRAVPEIDPAVRIERIAAVGDGVIDDTDDGLVVIADVRAAQRDRPVGVQRLLGQDLLREVVHPEGLPVFIRPFRPPPVRYHGVSPSSRSVLSVLPERASCFIVLQQIPFYIPICVSECVPQLGRMKTCNSEGGPLGIKD